MLCYKFMKYQKSVLENGLRVVSLRQPQARSVTMGLLVEAGSSVEPEHQRGLAHLLEHMIFQGTSNRDGLEIARLMDSAGGRMGAFTSRDYTCYYAQILADYVPYALDLFGDLLLNPVFDPDALEREKRAIQCEWQSGQDNPEQRVHEIMRDTLWPDHALGRPILGTLDGLESLAREDLIYFLHTHYQPNRIVVAAAGNLHHDDFVAQVRDGFWRLLGERAATPVQPPVAQPALVLQTAPSAQSYFSLGLQTAPFASEHRATLHVLNAILGGGISSRLFIRLREQLGLVYDVTSTYDAWRDAGLWTLEGSTTTDALPVAVEALLNEVTSLLDGSRPIDVEELHRAKVRLAAQIQLAAEDTHTLMSRLATQELYFGRFFDEESLLQDLEAVCLDTLQAWIDEHLASALRHSTLAVLGQVEPHRDVLQKHLDDAHWKASSHPLTPCIEHGTTNEETAPWD